jgi:AraC family transcriptional regulator
VQKLNRDIDLARAGDHDDGNIEEILDFPGGRLEIRQTVSFVGSESVYTPVGDRYLLEMSLSRRPTASTATNIRLCDEEALGRIFLVPPGETIRIFTPQGRLRSIRCILEASLINSFLSGELIWDGKTLREAFRLGGGQIEWLLWRMYRELQKSEIGAVQIIEGLAKQLSVEIIRRFGPTHPSTSHHAGGLAPWRLRLIEKRANEQGHLPSLEELAQVCDMSVRHLSRAFRMETGQTVGKYLETVMAQRAHGLLMEGVPVGRIAQTLGYSRAGNFAHAFRRATGLLPTEVKRWPPGSRPQPAHQTSLDR